MLLGSLGFRFFQWFSFRLLEQNWAKCTHIASYGRFLGVGEFVFVAEPGGFFSHSNFPGNLNYPIIGFWGL